MVRKWQMHKAFVIVEDLCKLLPQVGQNQYNMVNYSTYCVLANRISNNWHILAIECIFWCKKDWQ